MQSLVARRSASMNSRTILDIKRLFILVEKRCNEQQEIEIRHSLQQQWNILVKCWDSFSFLIDVT